MAVPPKQASSRWGSFLQQAVAGVESRLDNILAEGTDEAAGTSKPLAKPGTPTPKVESGSYSAEIEGVDQWLIKL